MTRFSTSLDVSEELDDVEESSEELSAGKPEAAKPKNGRDYAQEFEVYDREEDMDEEMDELDSEFNSDSKVKTVSNGWAKKAAAGKKDADEEADLNADKDPDEEEPEKEKDTESDDAVVKEYDVVKKQKAEFTDVDEVVEPKKKSPKGNGKGNIRKETDYGGNGKGNGGGEGNERETGEPKAAEGNGKKLSSFVWALILIALIIAAGATGYLILKNARQHAAETNLSAFPEQIAKDNELAKQSLGENLNISIAEETEPAGNETTEIIVNETAANETNETGTPVANETVPTNETVANETTVNETMTNETTNETAPENDTGALKDVLIQGLS